MKFTSLSRYLLSCLLLTSATTLHADDTDDTSSMLTDLNTIVTYIQNLGMYFGYDVTNYCTSGGSCGGSSSSSSSPGGTTSSSTASFSNQLTNATTTYTSSEFNLISSFLGALLPSAPPASKETSGSGNFQLVPTTNSALSAYATWIDSLGNNSFSSQSNPFSSPGSNSFSVSPLIDQQVPSAQGSTGSYQLDPVNQSILNILSTPDVSFCEDSSGNPLTTCAFPTLPGNTTSAEKNSLPTISNFPLTQVQVMLNTMGANFASASSQQAPLNYSLPEQNVAILPQLNSDSLLGPLMFDNSGSSNGQNPNTAAQGLQAANQVQQAANYIRYASGAVTPPTQPNQSIYTNLYITAMGQGTPQPNNAAILTAQSTLINYLANLRVYAAQTSVGVSNLYYILSRRMPVTPTGSTAPTSQALSEFNMATWRLAPQQTSSGQGTQTWVSQINSASSATVEKEIAVLLAEINYQLYLSRVQQERLLLTNSTLLLQGAHNTQPASDLSKSPAADNEPPPSGENS